MLKFQTFQSVRVTNKDLARFGQVGTYVGQADEAGHVEIKFEGDHPTDPQVVEVFNADDAEGL